MELRDLADEGARLHYLDAVDRGSEKVKLYEWSEDFTDCQMLRFRLDGIMYCVTEDPDDGYRSSMRDIQISDVPAMNLFTPEAVRVRYLDKKANTWGSGEHECDLLEVTSETTGEVLLLVGTDDADDYYPSFVAEWHPEGLSANADRRTGSN